MARRHPSRRETLRALGALAGAAALPGCGTEPGDGTDTDTDAPLRDPKEAIRHVVVLMMENRSFDHVFGSLSLLEGRDDVDGLTEGMANPDAEGQPVPIHRLEVDCQADPSHSWEGSREQLDGGTCDGFVRVHLERTDDPEIAKQVMGYYTRDDLPVYYALADAHTICDRWFCSVLGPTWPNRFYSLCGTSDGHQSNKIPVPFQKPSILGRLTAAGVDWKVYFHEAPFAALLSDNEGGLFGDRLRPIDELFTDLTAGTLPTVVFIEPGYTQNDDHPPRDVQRGQAFIATVYTALAASDAWDGTVLIVDYDEHGGFYDHVAPPKAADDLAEQGFDQLGFRIPGMVLGPWAKPGACVHTQYDHTSVLKLLSELHDLEPLSARAAAATALWDCLDLDAMAANRPHPPATIPTVELPLDFVGRDCQNFDMSGDEAGVAALAASQPELAAALDAGVIPARYDRRELAQETADRVFLRGAQLGVVRFR